MGATKEQAEKTRQDLLDAALIIFSKKGFNATRLEDISKAANVTRGAFYWHFKNKTEVFCELHRRIMNDFVNTMKGSIDNSQTPLQNLKDVLQNTINETLRDENAQRCGKLFFNFEYTPDVISAIKKIKEEMGYPVRKLLFELISDGKEKKEIREDLETEAVFIALISTLIGTIDQIIDDFFTLTEKDVEVIINIFIDGIKNKTV